MYADVTLIAFVIDRIFGEFKWLKHPVVFMGDFINWFEKKYYQDSIKIGAILTASLLLIVAIISLMAELLPFWIQGIIASTTIAGTMLYKSVKDIIKNKENIKYLVSRDTKELSQSDINKAAIETYAENLSDGVVAPLFYLFLFGLSGAFIYKAINTLDSMVGYKNQRYKNFGKTSAKLDDLANYIPSRITAFLIQLLFFKFSNIKEMAKKHESPNAGYPITAMAKSIGVTLGGDTSYFGKTKKKAKFGDGKEDILDSDILKALSIKNRFDIFIIVFLCSYWLVL